MTTAPFGVGGRPRRKTHPYVEEVPRIDIRDFPKVLALSSRSRAREGFNSIDTLGAAASTIRVVVNDAEMTIETVSDPRHLGGAQRYFLCGACGRRVWHLYFVQADERAAERLLCRRCAGPLEYRSKHTRQKGLNRARRLREKIGALPSVLAPLPSRPAHWRRDYWTRRLVEIMRAEAVIAGQVRDTLVRVQRRAKRDRQHSNRAI